MSLALQKSRLATWPYNCSGGILVGTECKVESKVRSTSAPYTAQKVACIKSFINQVLSYYHFLKWCSLLSPQSFFKGVIVH